jgi:hypothetical protein
MLLQNGSQPNPEQFAQDYASKIIKINQDLENARIEPYPQLTGKVGATVSDRNDYFTA